MPEKCAANFNPFDKAIYEETLKMHKDTPDALLQVAIAQKDIPAYNMFPGVKAAACAAEELMSLRAEKTPKIETPQQSPRLRK